MSDPELDAIRQGRLESMQEMQAGQKQGGAPDQNANAQKRQESAAKEEEMKNTILSQVLDQGARARLSTIAAAKPDKAKQIENMIINMARFGQISGKLNDEALKGLLNRVSEQATKSTTVKFDRRRVMDSDDDDDEM